MIGVMFEFNSCDVCTNPEIAFRSQEYWLAWNYIEIKLAAWNGKWDYGLSCCGGGIPCTKSGKFESREAAVAAAIANLLEREKRDEGLADGVRRQQPFDELHKWLDTRNQLTLF
jgi:hypothetical protein